MNIKYFKVLIAVTAVMLIASMSVCAYEIGKTMLKVSGEIAWVDVKLGKLQLQDDTSRGKGATTEYRINQNDTRVTDPADKKFLKLEDLRAGQHVTMEVIGGKAEQIVQNIVIKSLPSPYFQEAYGEIESIDVTAGTLVIVEKPRSDEEGSSRLSYFTFEPRDIIFMQSPSEQPVKLELKPGDTVKVEYVVKDGKKQTHSIKLYSPQGSTSTTTTTTTTTTR